VFDSEGRNGTLSGEIIDIHLRWSVAPGYEDSLRRVYVSILDITKRKKAEALAQKQSEQAEALSAIANALSAASLNAEAIYAIITAQAASLIGDACFLTLVSSDLGQLMIAAFHHSDPNKLQQMREILSSGSIPLREGMYSQVVRTGKPLVIPTFHQNDFIHIHEPGYQEYLDQFGAASMIITPIHAEGRVIGTLGAIRDVPALPYALEDLSLLKYLANQTSLPILNAQLHEQIKRQAHLDPLTGIPNRRHFFETAEVEFQRSQRYRHNLAVIMLDIDFFKNINDTFGHEVGDQMLTKVAETCRSRIRTTDLVGRYGGDEFLILLPETDIAGAKGIAESIQTTIENQTSPVEDNLVRITVSLGIAMKSESTLDLVQLLRFADEAMYAAKQAGRNQIIIYGETSQSAHMPD
jgi:two-component system, cell cycle response regulator